MLALRSSREGGGIINGYARGDRDHNDRKIEVARWCKASAIGHGICGDFRYKRTTSPVKVSRGPFRPKGCECSLILNKRPMDIVPAHVAGNRGRPPKPQRRPRPVPVCRISSHAAQPVAEASVPVPHIEMKGNGTTSIPARITKSHGDRTEKRPPVLELLCNHPFHRLSRPKVNQLSRSLSPIACRTRSRDAVFPMKPMKLPIDG